LKQALNAACCNLFLGITEHLEAYVPTFKALRLGLLRMLCFSCNFFGTHPQYLINRNTEERIKLTIVMGAAYLRY
jgi:hypothetical protein